MANFIIEKHEHLHVQGVGCNHILIKRRIKDNEGRYKEGPHHVLSRNCVNVPCDAGSLSAWFMVPPKSRSPFLIREALLDQGLSAEPGFDFDPVDINAFLRMVDSHLPTTVHPIIAFGYSQGTGLLFYANCAIVPRGNGEYDVVSHASLNIRFAHEAFVKGSLCTLALDSRRAPAVLLVPPDIRRVAADILFGSVIPTVFCNNWVLAALAVVHIAVVGRLYQSLAFNGTMAGMAYLFGNKNTGKSQAMHLAECIHGMDLKIAAGATAAGIDCRRGQLGGLCALCLEDMLPEDVQAQLPRLARTLCGAADCVKMNTHGTYWAANYTMVAIASNAETQDPAVMSRLLRLNFSNLVRQDTTQAPTTPLMLESDPETTKPPPVPLPPTAILDQMSSELQTLFSCLGPELSKIAVDDGATLVSTQFLGQMLNRPPDREERMAALTFEVTCRIYSMYTQVSLDYFVDWIAHTWVPQTQRQLDDAAMEEDKLGLFCRHVNDCLTADVKTNSTFLVWDHLMRKTFIAGVDPNHLVRGKYYAIALDPTILLLHKKLGAMEKIPYSKSEIKALLRTSFANIEPKNVKGCFTKVKMADLSQHSLLDHYYDNSGRMPTSVRDAWLTKDPQFVVLIHADVFKRKVNASRTVPVHNRDQLIADFKEKLRGTYCYSAAPNYYPSEFTVARVAEVVAAYEYTREIGLDAARISNFDCVEEPIEEDDLIEEESQELSQTPVPLCPPRTPDSVDDTGIGPNRHRAGPTSPIGQSSPSSSFPAYRRPRGPITTSESGTPDSAKDSAKRMRLFGSPRTPLGSLDTNPDGITTPGGYMRAYTKRTAEQLKGLEGVNLSQLEYHSDDAPIGVRSPGGQNDGGYLSKR
jgi:hypothetical protein